VMASALTITHHRHRRLRPGGFRSARFRRVAGDPPMSAEVEVTFTFRVGNASPHDDQLLADIVAVDADIVERQQRRRRAQRRLHLGANVCAAMVQGGYLQSYARTRRRGETILPPVMPAPIAMECQILAVKGNYRRIRPNAAKAAMEPHHAIIGARWDCRAEAKHQKPNRKS
jgi:hypothetical protein